MIPHSKQVVIRVEWMIHPFLMFAQCSIIEMDHVLFCQFIDGLYILCSIVTNKIIITSLRCFQGLLQVYLWDKSLQEPFLGQLTLQLARIFHSFIFFLAYQKGGSRSTVHLSYTISGGQNQEMFYYLMYFQSESHGNLSPPLKPRAQRTQKDPTSGEPSGTRA